MTKKNNMTSMFQEKASIFLFIIAAICILISSGAIFYFNKDHKSEQRTYTQRYVVLGENIYRGIGYRYEEGQALATYPLWGYPFIVGTANTISKIHRDNLILAFQLISSLIVLFGMLWKWRYQWWIIIVWPLFIPIFTQTSVKWPDAFYLLGLLSIVGMVELWLKSSRVILIIFLSILGGILVIFRPDFLFMLIFVIVSWLTIILSNKYILKNEVDIQTKKVFSALICLFISAFIGLIPWAVHNFEATGSPKFTSTNGGLVFYITLGQLPENPWGRIHNDDEGKKFVQENGVSDPVSADGDLLLRRQAITDIRSYPKAFIIKFAFNIWSAVRKYPYMGEFQSLFQYTENNISKPSNEFSIDTIKHLLKINFSKSFSYFNDIFRWILRATIVFALFTILLGFHKEIRISPIFLLTFLIFLFALFWIGIFQNQPRHMNTPYIILVYGLITQWYFLKTNTSEGRNKMVSQI